MTNNEHTIIVLPFISDVVSSQISKIESATILAMEYKMSPLETIKIIDLNLKRLPLNIKPENNTYKISDLTTLSTKYNAKYALIFKLLKDESNINLLKLTAQLYNMSIAENIENWEASKETFYYDKEEINILNDDFNKFITDSVNKITSKAEIKIEETIASYLEKDLITNIPSLLSISEAIKKTKDTNKKIELLKNSINLEPSFEFAYFELAKLFRAKKKYSDSITNYKIAIEKTPIIYHKALYYNQLGVCYSLNNNFHEAIDAWMTANEYKPDFINPLMNLAMEYEEKEDFYKAEKYFLEMQNIDPTDCRSYFSLARLYSKTGNWIKAIDQYKKQIDIKPQDAWSHSNIANCYMQMGKNKEAKTFFYQTIDLDPDGEAGSFAKQILEALEESTKRDWWKFWRK